MYIHSVHFTLSYSGPVYHFKNQGNIYFLFGAEQQDYYYSSTASTELN